MPTSNKRAIRHQGLINELGFRMRRRGMAGATWLARFFREHQLHLSVLVQIDLDMPAIDQSPEQQLVGQGAPYGVLDKPLHRRSEEHTSELQSLMRNSYAVFWW